MLTAGWDQLWARGARALERGLPPTALPAPVALGATAAQALWARVSSGRVRRQLDLPRRAAVVGIGGAVLGGAGKTPVAIALARELASRGAKVALVGHGYRGRPGSARVVRAGDPVRMSGDDAAWASRMLEPHGVPVVVGQSRQAAIDLAATLADVLIVDGLLQASPERLRLSVLVVDARTPWGSNRCPPMGDLRAPRAALIEAADLVAAVDAGTGTDADAGGGTGTDADAGRESLRLAAWCDVADAAEGPVALSELRGVDVGVVVGVARPDRILCTLRLAGIEPRATVALRDHATMLPADLTKLAGARVAIWLTTGRCAVKLPSRLGGAPVAALRQRIAIGPLADRVASLRERGAHLERRR